MGRKMFKSWYRFNAQEISVPNQVLLDAVSVEIAPHTKILLTGDNGSGKSTLMSYLAGGLANNHSNLEFKGKPVYTMSAAELAAFRHLVFQSDIPYPSLQVQEYLEICNLALNASAEFQLQQLEVFGIPEIATSPIQHLSGGEWMRVRLATAWLSRSEIVFLDEADAPLDKNYRSAIFEFLLSSDRTIVAISHNKEIQSLAWDEQLQISDRQLSQI